MFCFVLVMAKIFTNTKSLCRSYFKQKRCAFIIIWPLLVQELLFRKLPFHLSAIQCGLVFVALPVSIWWHFFLKALQILEIKVSVVAIVLPDFIFFFFFQVSKKILSSSSWSVLFFRFLGRISILPKGNLAASSGSSFPEVVHGAL